MTNSNRPDVFLHLRPILRTPEKEFLRYHENSSKPPGVKKRVFGQKRVYVSKSQYTENTIIMRDKSYAADIWSLNRFSTLINILAVI